MKEKIKTKMGRPLLYGEQTIVYPGFHCPLSKKKDMDNLIKSQLKKWEVNREKTDI